MGAKVFGAFLEEGEPVGRIEIMPIEAAPVPLEGDGLWVIRCIWVLDKACGLGIAGSLMRLALDAAQGSKGVAVLTYPGWMPPAFFKRFGFEQVEQKASRATALLRKADPRADVRVSLASSSPAVHFGQSHSDAFPQDAVRVEAVFGLRCPWVMQQYRKYLSIAGSISDIVITREYVIRTHADALRLGEGNLYIDGVAPFSGPIRREELERVIKERLARKAISPPGNFLA
ncbi:MAG: GNAT family N-acetyltransferase [Clostridia bacterium]|nr:GNAT family N-acetyltransferase [Clostridia bacterium]